MRKDFSFSLWESCVFAMIFHAMGEQYLWMYDFSLGMDWPCKITPDTTGEKDAPALPRAGSDARIFRGAHVTFDYGY